MIIVCVVGGGGGGGGKHVYRKSSNYSAKKIYNSESCLAIRPLERLKIT